MKKILTILFFLFIPTILLIAQDTRFTQNCDPIKEDINNVKMHANFRYGYISPNLIEQYPGAIPNTSNFWDYQTNGANLNQLWIFGDTVIVAYMSVDSTDPTGASTRINWYIYSIDGGLTWTTPIQVTFLPNRSAYPDLCPYLAGADRNVVISGRKYNASASRGGAWSETMLGLGSFLSAFVPDPGRDLFGWYIGNNKYGGAYSSPDASSNDSLFYVKYDVSANTFSNKTTFAVAPNNIYQNVRYRHTANATGTHQFVMWWDNTTGAYALRYKTTTDGGSTWSATAALQIAFGLNGTINGDVCSPWFGYDAAYKPGTNNWYCVWSTLYPTATGQNTSSPGGCKILLASPVVNGGVPVEVAGRTNMIIISDTINYFFNRAALQVGVTPVSHPSIAFSDDGSRIVVAFSAFQPGDSLDGFNFNDIWVTFSDNGGQNWATPWNLTNTQNWDELYPVLSPTGNTPNSFKIRFQATRGPGSQSFSNNAPVYRVYQIYKVFNPQGLGTKKITSEVPEKFTLYQNYPNPFNPSTRIKFAIPQSANGENISIKVYDILGKEIADLYSGKINAGEYEVEFNGSKLSSGVYFYQLKSEKFIDTKRMILVK